MDFYFTLKTVSTLAAGGFGALSVLTSYKDKDGKLTRWGKLAIAGFFISGGLSLALYGMDAAKAQVANEESSNRYEATRAKLDAELVETQRVQGLERTSLERSQALEEKLKTTAKSLGAINATGQAIAKKQASLYRAQLLEVRGLYPIAPLGVSYTVTFSSDGGPSLAEYVRRIRAATKRNHREDRALTVDDCYTWVTDCPETITEDTLISPSGKIYISKDDATDYDQFFAISDSDKPKEDDYVVFSDFKPILNVKFSGGPAGELVVESLDMHERPDCSYSLSVNFVRHQFKETVYCSDLHLRGSNGYASSFDLIGKTMKWSFYEPARDGHLNTIGFKFPSQLSDPFKIDVSGVSGSTGLSLTDKMLNLTETLKAARLERFPPP